MGTSQKQIEANRSNAAGSTGPRTAEGKARSSANALKHGLFSSQTVLSSEDRQVFGEFRQRMLDDLRPHGGLECMLADRVVCEAWRLRRAVRIEQEWMQAELTECEEDREIIPDAFDGAATVGEAVKSDFHEGRYDRLRLYEARIERSMHSALERLRAQQAERRRAIREAADRRRAARAAEQSAELIDGVPLADWQEARRRFAPETTRPLGDREARRRARLERQARREDRAPMAVPDRSVKNEPISHSGDQGIGTRDQSTGDRRQGDAGGEGMKKPRAEN